MKSAEYRVSPDRLYKYVAIGVAVLGLATFVAKMESEASEASIGDLEKFVDIASISNQHLRIPKTTAVDFWNAWLVTRKRFVGQHGEARYNFASLTPTNGVQTFSSDIMLDEPNALGDMSVAANTILRNIRTIGGGNYEVKFDKQQG